MVAVIRDGWIVEKYFDDRIEAKKYREYCARNFLGSFTIRWVSDDYPRRYDRAILATF
jgi:hypothetical protein